ncbi:MAG: hypothetical protein Q4B82_08260 [Alysiella sp.]|uniref:hypothetical protein n=1 Tax=Alysiella sp. TaxID=1872483 RepID=UPI0026DAD815|nr:hypothetical protein [Alysiella sp.]MDO4434554.1 hypothetical protein [Alysiella sp.]
MIELLNCCLSIANDWQPHAILHVLCIHAIALEKYLIKPQQQKSNKNRQKNGKLKRLQHARNFSPCVQVQNEEEFGDCTKVSACGVCFGIN